MADDKRERGARNMEDVCGMPAPPAGFGRFVDLTVEHLFGEVWGNDALSVRDRRLVVLGILAALGDDVHHRARRRQRRGCARRHG